MKNCITLLLIFVATFINAQGANDFEFIQNEAKKVGNALVQEDYRTVLKYTHPKLLSTAGGEDRMLELLRATMKQMAEQGIKISQVEIEAPEKIYQGGAELYCLLPQTLTMTVQGGTLASKSGLLGISGDKGKNWYFLDIAQLTNENVTDLFPEFNKDLVFPERQQPVFTPN